MFYDVIVPQPYDVMVEQSYGVYGVIVEEPYGVILSEVTFREAKGHEVEGSLPAR